MCWAVVGKVASAVVGGVGTVISTYQQGKANIAAGKFNQKMYEYQAGLNSARAQRAEEAGAIAESEAADRMRQTIGSGRTAYASSGLLLDGAPTDAPNMWEQDQAAMLAYEQAGISDAAGAEAWGFRSQAAMDKARAKWAKMSGYAAARSNGYANLASSLSGNAGTASDVISYFNK